MEIKEPRYMHNFYENIIKGDVKHYEKYFNQVTGLYQNIDGINPDTKMYTVYSCENDDEKKLGNLYWGLTILEPVLVNGECNMTRGHFHANRDCAEYYFGTGGQGLLLFMDENGECFAEKVFKGSLHYINGKYAHRFINTCDVPCSLGACWPSAAGHDYKAIEERDFPYRVFKINGEIVIKDR